MNARHTARNPARPSATPGLGRFAVLCLGVWLHSADTLVTATLAPATVADLGGVAYINWTFALYEAGSIIAGALAAVLSARWGIKRVCVGATLLYAGGCVLAAAAPSMAVLVGGRLVQGLGGGLLLALCYVAIQAWFAPALWGRLFGIEAMTWGAGSLLGPLIGGLFAYRHAWRWAFWAFAIQAGLLCVLAALSFPSAPRQTDRKILASKWSFLPLMVLTAATLLIAEAGAAVGTTAGVTLPLGCSVVGISLLFLAARLDGRSGARLLPRQLLDFRHPVGAGLLLVFSLSLATTGFWTYGPLIVQVLFGIRPLVTGYILGAEAVAWSLATLAVSSAKPSAESWLIRTGALSVAAGATGYALVVPAGSLPGMIGCGLLQGIGFGMCWPAIVQRTVRFSHPEEQSLASTSVSTVQRTGYAVGTAAVGLAANISGLNAGVSIAAAKTAGFWVFAAFTPALAVALWGAWTCTHPSLAFQPLHPAQRGK